jgi:hypothetical protein
MSLSQRLEIDADHIETSSRHPHPSYSNNESIFSTQDIKSWDRVGIESLIADMETVTNESIEIRPCNAGGAPKGNKKGNCYEVALT